MEKEKAKEKILEELDAKALCDERFLGQMSSFYFSFKDPLNDQIEFYSKYKIQIPFIRWNNKTLFRISIQAYNSKQDILRFIKALKDYKKFI